MIMNRNVRYIGYMCFKWNFQRKKSCIVGFFLSNQYVTLFFQFFAFYRALLKSKKDFLKLKKEIGFVLCH